MTHIETADVAAAWIRFEIAASNRGDSELENSAAMADFWAAELAIEWSASDPNSLWALIVDIWRRIDRQDQRLLGALAAGPVEDLLSGHGVEYFRTVEAFCAADPDFKRVLRMVWRNTIATEVWQKLQDLCQYSSGTEGKGVGSE